MIGKTISHYKILEKLGQGGMGVVYRAEDTKLKRLVALKFLPQDLTQDQEATKRFIYEAQTASALDHLNVCTIHEIDEIDDSRLFISMAYYEGETLKQKIARGPLPIEEAVDITIQIAQGLAKAHEKGIIHRDIKPANIIVQRDGSVKIIDFGLSKLMRDQSITKSGSTLGTVAYMSEEQALGKKVDHRSDIWSLGVVLYEMLTGQQPFKGEYEQTVIYNIINKDPKPIKELRPEIPQELQEIVKRTLNKKPDSRFSSVAEMLEKLREYPLALKPVGAELFGIKPLLKSFKQPRVALPAILILTIFMFFAIQFFIKNSHARWARYEALPEAARLLLKEQNLVDAFLLAQQAQRYIPDDPQAEKLLNSASYPRVLRTTPSRADVYFKDYFAVGAEWHYIGRTPIDSTRLPVSYLRIRVTRKGFETAICAVNIWMTDTLQFKLTPKGTAPPGMVLVPGGRQQLGSDDPVELQEYWLDKYEVTNKQYKKFVDAGGYQMLDYWKHPFVRKGRTLSWEQAMTEFRDVTGRPGPSTWKLGTYPDGQAEYPVRGVSWYEAAAYAEFAGKSLPTV